MAGTPTDPRRRDDAMTARIGEERQRRRWTHAAVTRKGAGGLRPHAASLVVDDAQGIDSSSILV
jgi:hypothetical protein